MVTEPGAETVCPGVSVPVLPRKLPVYCAVIVCVAVDKVLVVSVDWPDALSVTGEPRFAAPSLNWTVPVGAPG